MQFNILYLPLLNKYKLKTKMSNYTATQTKGIYKTQFGKYRVRKMVNGTKITRNFNKLAEARTFKNQIN